MHIGVLTHNYPRFPGDFSGTFVEALCQEFAYQQQQVTVWAPYDPAYARPLDDSVKLRLYRYAWPDTLHRLGYMRTMQADLALRLPVGPRFRPAIMRALASVSPAPPGMAIDGCAQPSCKPPGPRSRSRNPTCRRSITVSLDGVAPNVPFSLLLIAC